MFDFFIERGKEKFNEEALEYRLANAEASALITDMSQLPKVLAVRDRLPHLKTVIVIGAGRGRRLMPTTADAPKCFAEVAGKRLIDWAVYICEYGKFMLPFPAGQAADLPGPNVSYKRAILESVRWRGRAGQAPLARSSVQELTSASGNGAAGFEQPRRERANLF